MINVILSGCNGRMGQAVARLLNEREDMRIVAGVDRTAGTGGFPVFSDFSFERGFDEIVDVIIDFSHPSALEGVLEYVREHKVPAVLATTGYSKEQVDSIRAVAVNVPMLYSATMSIGINILIDAVCRAAKVLDGAFDVEIIEKHHNQKLDAPSGVALTIADKITESVSGPREYVYDRHAVRKKRGQDEIGIMSMRGGSIVGEHSVIFAGDNEVLEITHQATSREVFAVGAVRAAEFLVSRIGARARLYSMQDVVQADQ